MPTDIRPAEPRDVGDLARIDGLVSANPWRSGQFEAACSGPLGSAAAKSCETALVLESQARVCGFVVFSRVLDEASIHNIAVDPAQQGGGLGRRLLEAALGRMRHSGAKLCLLEVRESNYAARALYRSSGFHLDGVRKNYYPAQDGREDALLMSRQL